ncbi:KxYKxGKxW signal peptide domain-containing protein [Lacticaseibacillus pabuli]|uniref:KxYKxGKxW signal peptide domain-containing protein n=1 Tax=Lacticaseibacillus pabuli TaxID=3025672 RepID=A0ABY7WQ16_9LACO|nr:KxYKxGKxW signal peptide domain-containing protein [Lacticaseibacillus sp. KACC 23028]WDF81761.1 KxYKxGKxW signal peptide domain-containing protein [Lacticaseibacillus sp. KACC 23028]
MSTLKKRNHLIQSMTVSKLHYRMYKSGRQWVIAGVAVFALGAAGASLMQNNVAAADDGQQTEQQVGTQPAADSQQTGTTEQNSKGIQSNTADQSAQNKGQQNQNGQTQPSADAKVVTSEKPSTTGQGQSAPTPVPAPASTEGVTESPKTTSAAPETPTAQKSAQDAENTTDWNKAVTVDNQANSDTVQAGNQASYSVKINTTGIKTTLHNASLTLNLPQGTGVTLTTDLSTLAIDGVTPVLNTTTGQLVYDFGDLKSGLSASLALQLQTSAASNATKTLQLTGTLKSDEVTTKLPTSTVTVETSPNGAMTNSITHIQTVNPDDQNHINPVVSDTAAFSFGAEIPTTTAGTKLLQPGSDINLSYKLPAGMDYVGLGQAQGYLTDAPVSTPTADGGKLLSWTFKAPSVDSQLTSDPIYKFLINATVDSSIQKFMPETSVAKMSFVNDDGTTYTAKDADYTFMVGPYAPRGPVDSNGTGFNPIYVYNTADGNLGMYNKSGMTDDPTVFTENDPLLATQIIVTSGDAGNLFKTQNKMLKYLALHTAVDPNEVLQQINLGQATYRPNSSEQTPLSIYPYITLAVQYVGDSTNTYKVLASDIPTSQAVSIPRSELLSWGLDPTKTVKDIYYYYHMDEQPTQLIPANPNTFYDGPTKQDIYNQLAAEGYNIPILQPGNNLSLPDYKDFPADSGAPEGLFQYISYVTSVKPNFIGTISHSSYVQFDDSNTDDEIKYFKNDWLTGHELNIHIDPTVDQHRLSPSVDYSFQAGKLLLGSLAVSTIEVVHSPQGVERVVNATANLVNATTNGTVGIGTNTLSIMAALGGTSTANLVADGKPFSAYVLMPTGVTLNTTETNGLTIISNDYNGTGQQLVKADFGTTILPHGKSMSINLPVEISADTPTQLTFKSYLDLGNTPYEPFDAANTNTSSFQVVSDENDLNGNGDKTDKLIALANVYTVPKTRQVTTNQQIEGQGTLSDGTATTTPGGTATVTINTDPSTDANITSLDLLDVLPQGGTKGLTTDDTRDTDFPLTLSGPITLPAGWNGKVQVLYSTKSGADLDPSDASQWTNAQGLNNDFSKVTAFRIILDATAGETLQGGQQAISFQVKASGDSSLFPIGVMKRSDNTYSMSINGLQETEPHHAVIAITRQASNPGGGNNYPGGNPNGGNNNPGGNPTGGNNNPGGNPNGNNGTKTNGNGGPDLPNTFGKNGHDKGHGAGTGNGTSNNGGRGNTAGQAGTHGGLADTFGRNGSGVNNTNRFRNGRNGLNGGNTNALPQTGDAHNGFVTVMGLALAGLLSILGLGQKRRQEN